MHIVTDKNIGQFESMLRDEEKAEATVRKYVAAIEQLADFLAGRELSKQHLLEYRNQLLITKQPQTVNGALSAIASYLDHFGLQEEMVRFLKVQQQPFLEESRELQEVEYKRLLKAAQEAGNDRLYYVMMTICSTGIRVSELVYITVEAVKEGYANIRMKGKCRRILLPKALCKQLLGYIKKKRISGGHIFRTKTGKPLDRSNIGHDMKKLCKAAKVDPRKVFPHNLRHLFARCFIAIENNIAHLADVLGHSRIETTRLYVAVSAQAHKRILDKMRLVI